MSKEEQNSPLVPHAPLPWDDTPIKLLVLTCTLLTAITSLVEAITELLKLLHTLGYA